MNFRIKRYWAYIVATVVALVVPFVQIGGNQLFLLSFDKKQLHLMGVAFDMQELYMMPFLLMILFIGIFAMTAIGGRAWCGWACPQTIFRVLYRDLIETKLLGLRRIKNKQKEPNWKEPKNAIKRAVAIVLWSGLSLLAASDFMWYFVPPADFFAYMSNPMEHTVLLGFIVAIALFLVYDVVWLKEDFCIYICPYSRVQSVLYDDDTFQAIYHNHRGGDIYKDGKKVVFDIKDLEQSQECTTCQSCVTVCPTGIDIRQGMQLECINCLECVDACTVVMGKLGKESLVQWSSSSHIDTGTKVKLFRKKTIMYLIALGLIVGMLFVMGGTKEYMLLNINKTTQTYKIKDDGKRVINNFVLLFQNTQKQKLTYNLEVIGDYKDVVTIERFSPFKLSAGKLSKKVIRLSTKTKLSDNNNNSTPITIELKAYATEDPKVVVYRKAVFVYPRADKVKIDGELFKPQKKDKTTQE
ncbi:MAG: cytochrome c oxidase accessory protein CcoG [Campylobacteraceae bacterium 4484_166]|nr:MAG: cytochrome c oxidase accessory protein CcoG [Campylobacteraceae bacterium 4484_166]